MAKSWIFAQRFLCDPRKPLGTKRYDVLPQDRVQSRSREILEIWPRDSLKFDRRLGSRAADLPAEFQSDTIIITLISRFRDFTRSSDETSYRFANRGPGLVHGSWHEEIVSNPAVACFLYCIIANLTISCAAIIIAMTPCASYKTYIMGLHDLSSKQTCVHCKIRCIFRSTSPKYLAWHC